MPTLAILVPLFGYLRDQKVVPPEQPTAPTPRDELLARYRHHLVHDRGLTPSTVLRYERFARRFLTRRASRTGGEIGIEDLASAEISAYLLEVTARLVVDSAKREAADLRALLRFLYLDGILETDLGGAMPPVATWRGTRLPPSMSAADVDALLVSCDRSTTSGMITPSWPCWRGWVFAPARSLPSSSVIWTGAPGRFWFGARHGARTGSRFRSRSARRSWPTLRTVVRLACSPPTRGASNRSSVADPDRDSTPEMRAEDLSRLLTHLDAGPAAVLGSSGGAVSALALVRVPEQVHTVIAHEPLLNELLDDREEHGRARPATGRGRALLVRA